VLQTHRHYPMVCLIALSLAACGSDATSDKNGSGNSLQPGIADPQGHQAAQATSDAADNAASADAATGSANGPSTAARYATHRDALFVAEALAAPLAAHAHRKDISSSFRTTYTVQGCETEVEAAVVGSTSGLTFDANITYDPTHCSRGRKLSGTASLSAAFDGNGRTLKVFEDMTQTLVNGDVVAIQSLVANTPTYTLTATGNAKDGNVQLDVSVSEHRTRRATTGDTVFDVSISTAADAPLKVITGYVADANSLLSSSAAKTRTIASGTNVLVHNMAQYTARHTFADLRYALDTCNCPVGGALQEEVTYKDTSLGGYSRVYTFTACGTADVNTSASTNPNVIVGTSTVTWDSCH
jgi:hypothetical protein